MNKKLKPFVLKAQKEKKEGKSYVEVLNVLKKNRATYAISLETLEKLVLSIDEAAEIIEQSKIWDGHTFNMTALFFEFVELDDDLVD